MSKYTTGELAKLCNVTVRTVQYYDKRGILIPTELSEGGRRLYSESDLQRLQVICFLREVDVPIDAISQLLEEEHPEKVISILIEQQESLLMEEIQEKQEQLEKLRELQSTVQNKESFSLESIADIAVVMKGKKQLKKLYRIILSTGLERFSGCLLYSGFSKECGGDLLYGLFLQRYGLFGYVTIITNT